MNPLCPVPHVCPGVPGKRGNRPCPVPPSLRGHGHGHTQGVWEAGECAPGERGVGVPTEGVLAQ